MQADLAKCMNNLSIEECDVCPNCKQFRNTISHDFSVILSALSEYGDLLIFELALPTPDLSRPKIPLVRPGKKTHKFMSLREPLVDDRGPYCDDSHYGTTL